MVALGRLPVELVRWRRKERENEMDEVREAEGERRRGEGVSGGGGRTAILRAQRVVAAARATIRRAVGNGAVAEELVGLRVEAAGEERLGVLLGPWLGSLGYSATPAVSCARP